MNRREARYHAEKWAAADEAEQVRERAKSERWWDKSFQHHMDRSRIRSLIKDRKWKEAYHAIVAWTLTYF